MRTKKWFPTTALIALLLSVAVAQNYPESSQQKGARVGQPDQGKSRSGVSNNWSGVTLIKLKVLTEQDGVTVEITATRPVTPTLTRLTSPDRVVLDFPNTVSVSHQNVLAVNHDGVKSLRIGVQPSRPPMTRLVVDLLQPRTSELVALGDTIILKLRSVDNGQEKTAMGSAIEVAAILDPASPPSADTSSPEVGIEPSQPTLEVPQPTEVQQPVDASQDNAALQQPDLISVVRNLETGLPLRSVVSPLRWGHLSLLSVTAFTAYDINYQLQGVQQASLGSQLTVLQGLLIYSIQRTRWSLDFQYHPFLWFSKQTTHTDFAGHAVDFQTGHNVGRQWRLNVSDSYHYLPAVANSFGSPFSVDFSSNAATSNAFLSTGRKVWGNNANITMDRVLDERSKLSFTFADSYIRISGGPTNQPGTTSFGTQDQQQHDYGPGVTWSRQWNSRNTISLRYNYQRRTSPGSTGSTDFQRAAVGYTRVLKPSLTAMLQVGPGWSSGSTTGVTRSHRRITLQGSAGLFKQFTHGGVALTFDRSNDFSGVISNSYNNRYNLAVSRRFYTRWNTELSASYLQQEFLGRRATTGELGFIQLSYLLTRNWSLFTSYRYFTTSTASVNNKLFGPQQIVVAGIRWAWEPEKTTSK
jgi:AMIN domain-containing protein